jgi:peptide deformylase
MNEEKAEAEVVEVKEDEKKFRLRTILSDSDVMTLREVSDPVVFVVADNSGEAILDGETSELVQALKDAVIEYDGLGMAAPQLGVNKRVFVMRRPFSSDKLLTVINPTIIRGHGYSTKTEACFSIPNLPSSISGARVKRQSEIVISYSDEAGVTHEDTLVGMDSRAFQHELDHLNGRLMLDDPNFKGWSRSV